MPGNSLLWTVLIVLACIVAIIFIVQNVNVN